MAWSGVTHHEGKPVFRGRYEHAIDAKGRVSLPARYREALAGLKEDLLVVTTGSEACLRAYSPGAWREFEEKLAQRPQSNPSVRRAMRHYVGNAQECVLDGMGRVLLAPSLREYAGLQKEVVFLGQVGFIEIWSNEGWAKTQSELLEHLPADAEALAELGL